MIFIFIVGIVSVVLSLISMFEVKSKNAPVIRSIVMAFFSIVFFAIFALSMSRHTSFDAYIDNKVEITCIDKTIVGEVEFNGDDFIVVEDNSGVNHIIYTKYINSIKFKGNS